mgnify:CR=1 FL=1
MEDDLGSHDSFFVAHSMNDSMDNGDFEELDAGGAFDYDDDGNSFELREVNFSHVYYD